jgi:hypothetical protein
MNEAALKLLDAILESYDLFHTPKDITGDGKPETFCNRSVFHVLKCMGSSQLRDADGGAMLADQMIDAMRRSPAWQSVEMEQAQPLANEGAVVVAGLTSQELSAQHGHVVVVRPGTAELSNKWSGYAPKVSHCGSESLIGRSAAWAFPGKVRPGFWMLKPVV